MSETEHEQPEPETVDADEEEAAEEAGEGEQPEAPGEVEGEDAALDATAPPIMSETDIRKLRDRLDNEETRHANRVSEILGEDAQHLVPCELCEPGIPGFHWPVSVQQAYNPLHEALLDVLRNPVTADFEFDPDYEQCGRCKGKGQVKTHSEVANWKALQCKGCGGRGYVDRSAPSQNGPSEAIPVPMPVGAEGEQGPPPDVDAWGHPRLLDDGMDNPNYGRMPQYVDPRFP
jgi:hypothetical protein